MQYFELPAIDSLAGLFAYAFAAFFIIFVLDYFCTVTKEENEKEVEREI